MLEPTHTEIFPAKSAPSIEIKPPKPGSLRDLLKPQERTKPKDKGGEQLDFLLVFGQGPVLDETTKQRPAAGKTDARETAISWMKNAARAAGEMYLEGATKKIILTGGKTGGEQYKSEAELMRDILISEYHISENDIIVEDQATNTLQNIPLSLNKIDSESSSRGEKPKIGLLGADFHVPRIRLLADMFGISDSQSFSAEQIFRTIAYKLEANGGNEEIRQARAMHEQLDRLLSMNDDLSFPESRFAPSKNIQEFQDRARQADHSMSTMQSPTVFEEQTGNEKVGFFGKRTTESFLTRGMVEVPEFWFGYVQFLNDKRLMDIVSKTDNGILDRFGIKHEMSAEEIRDILKPYTVGKAEKGKRLGLEEFYGLAQKDDELTKAKFKVGEGRDEKATSVHDRLTAIAEKLNKLGNK